jgi:hypothetical protein
MCIHVIYNDNILAHSKCGTKYLDELFNIPWEKSGENNVKSPSELLNDNLNIKYVIIRNPKEHFLSAIDTLVNNEFYLKSIHNINDNHVYNSMNILYNDLDQHWCPNYCKYVYMLCNNRKITLVNLNDLSDFVKMELKMPKIEYTNSHGGRKETFEELENKCKEANPKLWGLIERILKDELYFYNKLINENTIFKSKKII